MLLGIVDTKVVMHYIEKGPFRQSDSFLSVVVRDMERGLVIASREPAVQCLVHKKPRSGRESARDQRFVVV